MIAGLYTIVPFLKKLIAEEGLVRYFLILGFIFAFAVPQAVAVLKNVSREYGSAAQEIVDQTYLYFVRGFSVYFILGYVLSRKELTRGAETAILLLGVLGLLTTVFGTVFLSRFKKSPVQTFYGNNTVNVLLEAAAVFTLFKKTFGKARFSASAEKIIAVLSKYSFGAYLVHMAIKRGLDDLLGLNAMTFDPLLSIPVTAVIVCILSFALSALLNRIPFVKKYLV